MVNIAGIYYIQLFRLSCTAPHKICIDFLHNKTLRKLQKSVPLSRYTLQKCIKILYTYAFFAYILHYLLCAVLVAMSSSR